MGLFRKTVPFWDILGNFGKWKTTNEKFWENMGLFRKKVPFWDILGNFGKWKTMVLYNRHLLISTVTTVFYLVFCLGKPVRGTRCTKNQEYTSMRMTGNICTKLGSISSCVDDLKPAHSFQLNLRKFSEFKTNCLCEILVAGF